jgi:hypothetical protein
MYPDKFEKIYEVDNVPITLYEIEEWWDNATHEQKLGLKSPDHGESYRYLIAKKIVKELEFKIHNKTQFDLLKRVKQNSESERKALDEILKQVDPKRRNTDYGLVNTFKFIDNKSTLDNIVSSDVSGNYSPESIFQQAMRMAREKLNPPQPKFNKTQYIPPPPPPPPPKPMWREILGFGDKQIITKNDINKSFRALAHKHHPDHGGSKEMMQKIIEARDAALEEIS